MTEDQVRALLQTLLRRHPSADDHRLRDRSEQSESLLELVVAPVRDGCASIAVRWWGGGRPVDVVVGEATLFEVQAGPDQERDVQGLVVAALLGDLAESVQYDAGGDVIRVDSTVWTDAGPRRHQARGAPGSPPPSWTEFRYEPYRIGVGRPDATDVFGLRLQVGRHLRGWPLGIAVFLRQVLTDDGGVGGLLAPAWVVVDDRTGRVVLRVAAGREPEAGPALLDELQEAAAALPPADFLHRYRKRWPGQLLR